LCIKIEIDLVNSTKRRYYIHYSKSYSPYTATAFLLMTPSQAASSQTDPVYTRYNRLSNRLNKRLNNLLHPVNGVVDVKNVFTFFILVTFLRFLTFLFSVRFSKYKKR